MKNCRFLLPALMAGLIFAMTSHAAPLDSFKGLSGTLDIAGGTAHIPVMKGAAKNIMTANPDIRITVAGGGSGVGVQQVGEGLVQIGNTGRALKEKEIAKYGLQSFPFAIDGVALVVNPANKVRAITAQQAQDIFAGKITNWKALGGADAPITVYTREDGSGTREVFVDKALKKGRHRPGQAGHRLCGHRPCGQERGCPDLRQDGPLAGKCRLRRLHPDPPALHEHQGCALRPDQGLHRLYLLA